ncbi:hypothetical protein [Candidatus Bandiella euplotis]|uniref:Uncharacterized protein n=1 Tax=Candidatus Bandiella euplotis TaxID=1664265 RepID=A0ABZ0UR43_9RICK|nr:hypothetical protein [Candidatus Bandiella woodruffii]WPX97380.1 hypothetical protein Bandiella_01529 [Candidatus Bandiella woodruffii]
MYIQYNINVKAPIKYETVAQYNGEKNSYTYVAIQTFVVASGVIGALAIAGVPIIPTAISSSMVLSSVTGYVGKNPMSVLQWSTLLYKTISNQKWPYIEILNKDSSQEDLDANLHEDTNVNNIQLEHSHYDHYAEAF